MRHNLEHEFYPLDRIRFSELMNETRFSTPKQYFKVLGLLGMWLRADLNQQVSKLKWERVKRHRVGAKFYF